MTIYYRIVFKNGKYTAWTSDFSRIEENLKILKNCVKKVEKKIIKEEP